MKIVGVGVAILATKEASEGVISFKRADYNFHK